MERYSIREVVDQALQTERLGYQFYTMMIQNFEKEEEMRKLFSHLAIEEKKHEKTFEDMLALVKDEEPANWEEAEQYLSAIVESEFFLGKNKALPSMEHVKTVADAVDFALEFEEKIPDRRRVEYIAEVELVIDVGIADVVQNLPSEAPVSLERPTVEPLDFPRDLTTRLRTL
jgi:hypothetical protein